MSLFITTIIVIFCLLFVVAFAIETYTSMIWAQKTIDKLRERRHQRKLEAIDKQIALENAKHPAAFNPEGAPC